MTTIETSWFNLREQANLIYQEDLEALTPDRVMMFISHHYNYQRPRLRKLDHYYQGRNVEILHSKTRRIDDDKADYRATHAFGKYIADFQTSYSVGNPINIKLPKTDERFNDISKANDVDAENYDLFLDMTRYGRAFELVYLGEDDIEHFARLDPRDTFMIYDLSVDPQPIMAVRYHQIEIVDDNNEATFNFVPEYWTATEHVQFQPTTIGGTMVRDGAVEKLITFPVTEFQNNRFRLGDYENVIPLIDLYDAAQSDTANYMTDLNDAMLVIKGDIETLFDNTEGIDPTDVKEAVALADKKLEMLKEMRKANLLLLKSGFNPTNGGQTNVDAGYIYKQYDVSGTEAYKKRLATDIHKFSHTPDLTDENFASNSSGVAMKYKMLGTVELASIKRRMFEKGLYSRYNIVAAYEKAGSFSLKTDPNDLQFTFRDNLPTDDISQITALQQAGAVIPQKYFYQYLPNVNDPQEIIDMLQEQRPGVGYSDDLTGDSKPVKTDTGNESQYGVGDKVKVLADHMPGMKGSSGTVTGVSGTAYMIDYQPTTGGQVVKNHKWVTGDELQPLSSSNQANQPSAQSSSSMKM